MGKEMEVEGNNFLILSVVKKSRALVFTLSAELGFKV